MDEIPDFSDSVDAVESSIITTDIPDFANSTDVVPPNVEVSPISKFLRGIFKNSPIEKLGTETFKHEYVTKYGAVDLQQAVDQRDDDIANEGVLRQLDGVMNLGIGAGAMAKPVATAAAVTAFSIKDHFFNARRWLDENKPGTAPVVKDLVEILDFGATAAVIGKSTGLFEGATQFVKSRMNDLNLPKNVDLPAENVAKVSQSPNLLPEEKIDLAITLGVKESHVESSRTSGLPINVPTDRLIDLTEKPYWERAKKDLLLPIEKVSEESRQAEYDQAMFKSGNSGSPLEEAMKDIGKIKPYKNGHEIVEFNELPNRFKSSTGKPLDEVRQELENNHGFIYESDGALRDALRALGSKEVKPSMANETKKHIQDTIKNIKELQTKKDLSTMTISKLKDAINIDSLKKADIPQLEKLKSFMGDLGNKDKFLSESQLAGLESIIKSLPSPEITPRRIVVEKFGEKDEILSNGILSKVNPDLIPTVNIKQGHPVITRIVNNARELFNHAEKEVSRRNKNFDKMITAAEKSRESLLSPQEKLSRKITPQNTEIFKALGGEKLDLTKEEVAVVAYLKNFFNKAKTDLALEKYRTNYVTHLEKSLTEKILTKGLIPAIKETLAEQKPKDLPVDIMLELDNIIGSEKFFKFASERKGGLDPSKNLRQIVNTYSNLYETKMALDKILPEGQAVTQTLLKGKSALWMKKFLQNLKGRGLDNQFKTGPMGWLTKVADAIVDLGYLKMLGFNYMSALKNVVAGESNSWIYSDFKSYLTGKQRLMSNPKRVYELAKEFGILDGTYADYAQKGIGSLKKLQDLAMIGQRAGEVEVRGSIMASMLTPAEWAAGKISKERINEMKDVVALTQGVFSKADSPLLLQTWYGRMFFQMNRWRITNALLMKDIVTKAGADIKVGDYKTQNVTRLGKMVIAYGTGMYIAKELYEAGYKPAGDVAKNMAQTIDGVATLFTKGDLVKMFTDNPTLHLFKEVSNTIQGAAAYLNIPGAQESRDTGIEDTYIAPIQTAEDILGASQ